MTIREGACIWTKGSCCNFFSTQILSTMRADSSRWTPSSIHQNWPRFTHSLYHRKTIAICLPKDTAQQRFVQLLYRFPHFFDYWAHSWIFFWWMIAKVTLDVSYDFHWGTWPPYIEYNSLFSPQRKDILLNLHPKHTSHYPISAYTHKPQQRSCRMWVGTRKKRWCPLPLSTSKHSWNCWHWPQWKWTIPLFPVPSMRWWWSRAQSWWIFPSQKANIYSILPSEQQNWQRFRIEV